MGTLWGFCKDSIGILLEFDRDSTRALFSILYKPIRILNGFYKEFDKDSIRILLGFCNGLLGVLWGISKDSMGEPMDTPCNRRSSRSQG